MVKILIDGKEYEGETVIVSEFDSDLNYKVNKEEKIKYIFTTTKEKEYWCPVCKKDYRFAEDADLCCKKFRPKQSNDHSFSGTCPTCNQKYCDKEKQFVSVPKEIQFVHTNSLGYAKIALKINKQYLIWNKTFGIWEFVADVYEENSLDCVLVPTKRKELKAGDWAFCLVKQEPDYSEEGLLKQYGDVRNYCLMLGERLVRVSMTGVFKELTEQPRNNVESFHWFKVVPRSELK